MTFQERYQGEVNSGTPPEVESETGEVTDAEGPKTLTERQRAFSGVIARLIEKLEKDHYGHFYHNRDHSKEVVEAARQILKDFGYTDDSPEMQLAEVAGYGHDAVVRAVENERGERVRLRGAFPADVNAVPAVRAALEEYVWGDAPDDNLHPERDIAGGNEGVSAEVTKIFVREADPEGRVISDEDIERISKSIDSTYPAVSFPVLEDAQTRITDPRTGETIDISDAMFTFPDQEGKRVMMFDQPHLMKTDDPVALAIAAGDLFKVGRDTDPAVFRHDGNAEFLESKKRIAEELAGDAELTPERKLQILNHMFDWWRSQVSFALGQKIRCQRLFDSHPFFKTHPDAKEVFWQRHPNFDVNIAGAYQFFKERELELNSLENEQEINDLFARWKGYMLEGQSEEAKSVAKIEFQYRQSSPAQ